MTIHLGNDSAVRRQSWADRARDGDGDVAASAEHADAHTGLAAASPGALLRLLAPSPRDPNAQRARSGPDADVAVRDQPPRLVKPSPPKLPREPMWHAYGPRGVAAEPVVTRLPSPAAPPQRETIVRAAVIAPRGQPIFGDGGAIIGAAGAAAAVAIATQPAPQPAGAGRLVRIAQSLQVRAEQAQVQGGPGWLHDLSRFSSRLHALIARLQTPVPALQAAARDAAALNSVTAAVHQRFAAQAGDKEAFTALLKQAFGDKFDAGKAETIRQQALAGDFGWAPKVQVVSSQALADLSGTQGAGIAKGAYVQSSDTIYISRELLHGDPAQAQRLLMEEMGHGLDARINASDAAGDEGEIFGKLMHGDAISAPEMAALRADNDHGVININGQAVTVEYGFFSKAFKAITGGIKKVVGAVTRGVVNLAKSAVTVATGLVTMDFDKVKDGLKDGVNAVKNSVKAVHEAIKDTAKELHRITKQAFQKLMQSKLFAAVLMICRFIPIPIVALVVHVIDLVRAAYMVYQGIKHKSLSAVLGGVASLVGGAGNVAGAFGASAATVNTIATVANAASKLSMAYNAVANKDLGSALGLLGGAVGGPGASAGMNTLASATGYAQQALNIREAVRNRDALAALGGTLGLAAGATSDNATRQSLSNAQEVVTGLRAAREIGRGNLDAAQSLAQSMGSARAIADDFDASVQQSQRNAEAANNRTLLNAADAELRAAPAEQDSVVPAVRIELNGNGLDMSSDADNAPRTVRAGDYKGSLERIARDRLGPNASPREVNDYVGKLFEINNITDARRIVGNRVIQLPDENTAAATKGLALYGADIQKGEQLRADRAAEAARLAALTDPNNPATWRSASSEYAAAQAQGVTWRIGSPGGSAGSVDGSATLPGSFLSGAGLNSLDDPMLFGGAASVNAGKSAPVNFYWEAGKASLGMLGNGLTTVQGGALVVLGAAAIATPEPTTLTKWGGALAVSGGTALLAKGSTGIVLNASNFYNAVFVRETDTSAYLPGSAAELLARKAGASDQFERAVGAADAGFDLATGKVFSGARFATNASKVPLVADVPALFQPIRAATIDRQMISLAPDAWSFASRAGTYAGFGSVYGSLVDAGDKYGWWGFAEQEK